MYSIQFRRICIWTDKYAKDYVCTSKDVHMTGWIYIRDEVADRWIYIGDEVADI